MKFAKFASAWALGLCTLGAAQAAPSATIACSTSALTTSNAGYVSCVGSFQGSLNGSTVLPSGLGLGSTSYFSSTDFAAISNPFSQDEGATDDGVINFDIGQTGKFVLGLKQSNLYSLYLFDGALVAGGITSIRYDALGIVDGNASNDGKLSHAGFFGTPVAAVPEPESYALLLAGLGLMGTIVRRRKAK